MADKFRATQDRNILHLEGTFSTPYPGYAYKVVSVTVSDDGTLEVQLKVYDPMPGAIRPCVIGEVEVYEELDLSDYEGFIGQELCILHLVSTGTYAPEIDVDVDQA